MSSEFIQFGNDDRGIRVRAVYGQTSDTTYGYDYCFTITNYDAIGEYWLSQKQMEQIVEFFNRNKTEEKK